MASKIGGELITWLRSLDNLGESKAELDALEAKASKLTRLTLAKLDKDIRALFKEVESKTGTDWSSYLDDFDTYKWQPGDLQEAIEEWLLGKIKEEASKLL